MKVLILLALAGVVLAATPDPASHCDYSNYRDERRGAGSGNGPNDRAYAYCGKGFRLTGCRCEDRYSVNHPNSCGGSLFQTLATGDRCVAFNKEGGGGVIAVSICHRTMITCTTPYTNMPQVKCPADYKMSGCAAHAFHKHNLWRNAAHTGNPPHPREKRVNDLCYTLSGCTHCSVQARCVRTHNNV